MVGHVKQNRVQLCSVDEFQAEVSRPGGRVPGVRKNLATALKSEDGKMSFVISTASPDRSHDTVAVEGWKLDNFAKNPVVLWAHDYERPPVARSGPVVPENGRLMAKDVDFVPREVSEFAWSVGEMYRLGFLSAVSVGFRPRSYKLNAETGGVDFQEQELLEFSAVPVPANPEALVAAKSVGIPMSGLVDWTEQALDGRVKTYFPRHHLEAVRSAAKGSVTIQVPADVQSDEKDGEGLSDLVDELRKLRKAVAKNSRLVQDNTAEQRIVRELMAEARKAPAPVEPKAEPQSPQKRVVREVLGSAVADAVKRQLADMFRTE
jgi:hypothetical protein